MDILPGHSFPIGATVQDGGVNFSLYSKNSTGIDLLLFDAPDAATPSRVIPLSGPAHRHYHYWHAFVPGVGHGQLYGFRARGPYQPERGHAFDGDKLLIDPYARALARNPRFSRDAARFPGENIGSAMKSVVVDTHQFDWEGDEPLNRPYAKTVIYEMHLKGFTMHPNSGLPADRRGTYLGLIDKIPYLQELGITAVELLPIQQFDPTDAPGSNPNYWGYSQMAFFAPHNGYAAGADPLAPVREFRELVKALHRAGIEVILDVVFNHTAESGHDGPVYSFRGLENKAYYMLGEDAYHQTFYQNYTGCGNTLNANHSVVRRLIMDCLRYWVEEMHVDGFRFDLASVLARDENGTPLKNPPILWEIESDPVLAGTKIIAEAWDAAGLYQVGSFIGDKWAEWNGRYRDDVRNFIRGSLNHAEAMMYRLSGSHDIYHGSTRDPNRSINFITCHDGFPLNDLVSYNHKHNLANGEDNRDGTNDNNSWNCGVEGPTDDPEIEALRLRQIKNFFSILVFSHGCPMLSMGDEVRRTQQGNNNAYCQDNELSYFDWDLVEKNADLLRFVRALLRGYTMENILSHEEWSSWIVHNNSQDLKVHWHGTKAYQPDLSYHSLSLAFSLSRQGEADFFQVMINAFWEPLTFELPDIAASGQVWCRMLDTARPSPEDIVLIEEAQPVAGFSYTLEARSVVALIARPVAEVKPPAKKSPARRKKKKEA